MSRAPLELATAEAGADAALPIYHRIREALRARIDAGDYAEGARLPSESELVEQFGVSRMTVRQALSQLVFEGVIVRAPGRGSFVAPRKALQTSVDSQASFEQQILAQGKVPTTKLLSFRRVPAPPEVCAQLKLEPGAEAYRLERLRLVDGEVVGLEERYIVEDVGARISRSGLRSEPTLTLLEAALGAPLGVLDNAMYADAAGADVATKLEVPRRSPVFIKEHLVFDQALRPVLFGHSIYRSGLRFRNLVRNPG